MRIFTLLAVPALLAISFTAGAQSKKSASAGPVITEATQQRNVAGRRETEGYTEYRFRLTWKGSAAPTSFYWRPDAQTWMATGVARPEQRPGLAPGDYMTIEHGIAPTDVRAGDALIITTRRHSHDPEPMPTAVKKMPVSSLYYQTSAAPDKWIALPVNPKKLVDRNLQ